MAPRINQLSRHTLRREPLSRQHVNICSGLHNLAISNKWIYIQTSTCVLCWRGPEKLQVACGRVYCHTGAQCAASPTRKRHRRAVEDALEPPDASTDSHFPAPALSRWPSRGSTATSTGNHLLLAAPGSNPEQPRSRLLRTGDVEYVEWTSLTWPD